MAAKAERPTAPSREHRAGRARPPSGDAGERHREHEPEGVDGAAQDRTEHPVPDELHQEEGEAHDRRRRQHEARRALPRGASAAVGLVPPSRRTTGPVRRPSAAARTATTRFTPAASHSVWRVPRASRSQNVAARQPATAPSGVHPVEEGGPAAASVALVLDRAGGGAQGAPRHEGRRAAGRGRPGAGGPPPRRRRRGPRCRPRRDRRAGRASSSGGVTAAVRATHGLERRVEAQGAGVAGRRAARSPRPPRPRPPMNTATTAAEAAVDAPKIRRNSRCQAIW